MNAEINNIQRLAYEIYRNREQIADLGLMGGKMGFCLNLYHIARQTEDKVLNECADNLLDEIYERVNLKLPVSFATGLAGIGWGIEHLASHDFVKADTCEVLEDFDNLIKKVNDYTPINEYSLKGGVIGRAIYFLNRLKNVKMEDDRLMTLQNKLTMINLIEAVDNVIKNEDKLLYFDDNAAYWDFSIILHFLAEAHVMDIYNSRVEKAIDRLIIRLENFSPKSLLEMLSLAYPLKRLEVLSIHPQIADIYKNLMGKVHTGKGINEEITGLPTNILLATYKIGNRLCMLDPTMEPMVLHLKYVLQQDLGSVFNNSSNTSMAGVAELLGLFDGFGGYYRLNFH